MKMKMIVLVLGLILLSATVLYGCGGSRELTEVSIDRNSISKLPSLEPIDVDGSDDDADGSVDDSADSDTTADTELIALADTLEDAEEIAELYDIELSAYSYGVATYTTDKNVTELMELGKEKGYPELSLNQKQQLYMKQEIK